MKSTIDSNTEKTLLKVTKNKKGVIVTNNDIIIKNVVVA